MSSIISKLINLAGNITGILPVVNGGTGVATSTGTVNVVLSNSPTLVTPVLGTPSSGNLSSCTNYPNVTQSVAGLVASAGQLLGTNTNDAASAGRVGEILTASKAEGSPVSLTTATQTNILASPLSVTAGCWLIWSVIGYIPGATTTIGQLTGSTSLTTAALPNISTMAIGSGGEARNQISLASIVTNAVDIGVFVTPHVAFFSGTTSLYLVAYATFGVSTLSAYGSIQALRIR